MAFSGALTLTDLNDYLGPSQACIKPVSGRDAPVEADGKEDAGAASTEIAIDVDGTYYEAKSATSSTQHPSQPRERTKLETAEISLNDCLACSGCVTSAETVLIGMQSVDELRKVLQRKESGDPDAPSRFVASISPQALASLSSKYSTNLEQPIPLSHIFQRIELYLKTILHFDVVFDTTFARHISLEEQAREYRERKKTSESPQNATPQLPMLASACPGWICYAEKTHGELLPLISNTRSPQQIAGLLAKHYVVPETLSSEERPAQIYHVSVMPCYDKKLEASRQDFFNDITQSKDVDLVLTTGELEDLMLSDGFKVALQDEDTPMTPPGSTDEEPLPSLVGKIPSLLQQPGSSSGSYLFDLMRRVWLDHLQSIGDSTQEPRVSVKTIRSADYTEYLLLSSEGQVIFKGAQCYGFRNLQNLVRKVQKQTGLKSKRSGAAALLPSTGGRRGAALRGRGGMVRRGRGVDDVRRPEQDSENRAYDFVEVMACPGGCVNGGGQIRPPGNKDGTSSSALTSRTIATDVTEAMVDQPSNLLQNGSIKSLDGWSTPPLSVGEGSGTLTPMSQDDEEPIQGWKGTNKEWVQRVEYLYWRALPSTSPIGSVHQAQALGVERDRIPPAMTKAMSDTALYRDAITRLDKLANSIVSDMVSIASRHFNSSTSPSTLLHTQYRALQDEAVSGLAVQW